MTAAGRIGLILLALAAPAGAADVRSAAGAALRPGGGAYERDDGLPRVAWLADEGVAWRDAPERGRAVAGGSRFMEQLIVAEIASAGGERVCLLARPAGGNFGRAATVGEYVGWAPERALLLKPQALRDEATRVLVKAMVVNNRESIRAGEVGAAALASPGPGARELQKMLLFNYLFVYARSGDHTLVGWLPAFDRRKDADDRDYAADAVIGWVPARRLVEWRTREAFEWDRDSTLADAAPRRLEPGRAYVSAEAAKDADAGRPVGDDAVPFREGRDPRTGAALAMKSGYRYPLLRRETSAGGAPPRQLFQVGMWGGFWSATGKRADVTQQDVDRLFAANSRLDQELKTLHVAFVIDDSEGMARWMKEAAATLKGLVAKLQREGGYALKVGATFYNTGADSVDETFSRLADANGGDYDTLLKALEGDRDLSSTGGKTQRQLLGAIKRAVDRSQFPGDFSRKLVVVLGRYGDEAGGRPNDGETVEQLAAKLVARPGSPIDFYAVQLADAANGEVGVNAFHNQMTQLGREMHKQAKAQTEKRAEQQLAGLDAAEKRRLMLGAGLEVDAEVEVFSLGRAGVQEQVAKSIAARLAKLRRSVYRFEEEARSAQAGDFTRVSDHYKLGLGGGDARLQYKLDPNTAQAFERVYVWDRVRVGDAAPAQMRVMLMASAAELQDVARAVEPITLESLDPAKYEKAMEDAADCLLQVQVGDPAARVDDEAARRLLNRRVVLFTSKFLERALTREKPAFNEKVVQDMADIVHRAMRLNDLRNEAEYEYTPREVTHPKGIRYKQYVKGRPLPPREGVLKPGERAYTVVGGGGARARWYWVDMPREWP